MKIAVFGTGYVGLVSGVGFAEMGNDVVGVDIDEQKIRALAFGQPIIYENGLREILGRNLVEGRLKFTSDAISTIRWAEMILIAVGTPSLPSGEADLSAVETVARTVGQTMDGYRAVVNKSTVPVGTSERVEAIILAELARRREQGATFSAHSLDVISNPEFLREGAAVKDFLNPDRIVVGVATPEARAVMERLYRPLVRAGRPLVIMDRRSAELSKYAANAFLATKVSFINEIANLCEAVGADAEAVAKAMGMDSRIGSRFLHAGIGWGGSCFPKDVAALRATASAVSAPLEIIRAASDANERQRERFVARVERALGGLSGKTIAVWGLAFKPRTDDVRASPALAVISLLLAAGAGVRAFDPVAQKNAEQAFGSPHGMVYCSGAYEALDGADGLCVLTEWDEFRSPDFTRMRRLLARPLVIDGRNIYDSEEMMREGFEYHCIGRSTTLTVRHFKEPRDGKSCIMAEGQH